MYIIVPAISAGNAYQRVGNAYTDVTFSLAKGELSTIEGQDQATRPYQFADLPCPPSDVASRDSWFYNTVYNPTRPYQPRISIPAEVTNVDPAWSSCTSTAQYQGFDPPTAVPSVDAPEGPGRRFRRGAASPLEEPDYANMPGANAVAPTALPTARPTNELDSGSIDSPGRLGRTVGQVDLGPQQHKETYKPTKTFVA